MTVKELLFQMLTENTGSHFLDSGGAYGRHWQRNQKKDLEAFEAAPVVTVDFYGEAPRVCDLCISVSVFHYLAAILDLDEVCNEFNETFSSMEDWESDQAYGLSARAEEWIFNMGGEFHNTINTYNHEEALSQTLQYTGVTIGGENYVLLQIHGGCDVRGGYTDAKLFTFDPMYDHGYMQYIDPTPYVSVWAEDKNGDEVWAADYCGEWLTREGSCLDWDQRLPETAVKIEAAGVFE